MAIMRDRPYTQFNFLVDLGSGIVDGPDAGFEEVTGLESSVDVIEYRTGNARENSPIKLTGLNRHRDCETQQRHEPHRQCAHRHSLRVGHLRVDRCHKRRNGTEQGEDQPRDTRTHGG